ncbi:hypothetical protein LV716_12415 [Flagellimonas sp. HMM57]|uniref:hypothetical protein n=1 Tax=unclassified Flagellimonas TaxID=2644544 RepID=UPI0013D6564A|nr:MULTISPECIES: hypothetical protein [unclassified Flagellimonas]UII75057.1 hypothetical protein LV716_12415 [Flagellimonas sp. HMM57]
MKNTKKAAPFLLVFTLLLLGACQPKQKENPKEEPKEHVEPPKQIISLIESKSLYDNYSKNRVETIQQYEAQANRDKNFKPSRFTSFDYKTMKQYMAFIEQEAEAANVDISTLRFYFATYPSKRRFPDGQRVVHPRQNSLFMLPTMKVKGLDYGFYIGADGKAKLVKDAVGINGVQDSMQQANGTAKASFMPSLTTAPLMQGEQSLTMNHGSSGPPPSGDF